MRVECSCIQDFLENMEDVNADQVYAKTLFVNLTRQAAGSDPRHTLRYQVTIVATVVVADGQGGEYLLVGGEICGLDYEDNGGDYEGTKRGRELRRVLVEYGESKGLVVKPGAVYE